jgi:hypothetical protein
VAYYKCGNAPQCFRKGHTISSLPERESEPQEGVGFAELVGHNSAASALTLLQCLSASGAHSCQKLSKPPGPSAAGRIA